MQHGSGAMRTDVVLRFARKEQWRGLALTCGVVEALAWTVQTINLCGARAGPGQCQERWSPACHRAEVQSGHFLGITLLRPGFDSGFHTTFNRHHKSRDHPRRGAFHRVPLYFVRAHYSRQDTESPPPAGHMGTGARPATATRR